FSYAFDPHESQSTLDIELPPAFLKRGENSLTITCVDKPKSSTDEPRYSGITYDALSLNHNGAKKYYANAISAKVQPTIFYRQHGSALTEVVEAVVRFNRAPKRGKAELELAGKRYSAPIHSGEDFGEERLDFQIPEWTGTAKGKLVVNTGRRRSFPVSLTPKRKWTIFVVPHTHLDVGFTDYQGKVAETQARVLTQAAKLIHEHPDFRFSMDGSWVLQQLLHTRSKQRKDEILNLIRSGKMAMPAQWCNLLTGYASLETLYRSLYVSKKLARHYGLPFDYANITDVPTYSGSYPSVLASSGIRYWVAASNNDRAPIFFFKHWNEDSPFWWEGPDGKKVLFWYSRHYEQVQTLFGLPPELNAIRESLPIFLQAYSKPTYKLHVALIYGTQVENTDLFPSTATFATDWNKQYAYPKLKYATFPEFFSYLSKHAHNLPTYKLDGGPYWEDGVGSDAYYTAEDRGNQNSAPATEILSSVTHSVNPNLNPPAGLFDDIWRNIVLFSEHTWASYNSVSQPDSEEAVKQLRVKDSRADRASLEIQNVTNRSLSQLADEIHIPAGTLVVFNSLGWPRNAAVETDLPEGRTLTDLTTNRNVPFEVMYKKEGFVHVRFIAKDLPPAGYKCFKISKGNQPSPQTHSDEQTIENAFYRIKVDPSTGSLDSIYDKKLGRELVNIHSPYKFGQYLYVTGGDGNTQIINPFPALPKAQLTVHPAGNGKYLGVDKMPWGESIRLESSDFNTPDIKTEILLFNNQKKIEFMYHLSKKYTTKKEGVYIAFPVAASSPRFEFATQQGWVDPAHEIMKGGSLEWFTVQHWMAVHDPDVSVGIVPIDAPLASFGDINRGTWPGTFKPKSGTMFSYIMNNYWHTNYRAGQGGDFTFRYVMTSAPSLNGGALTQLGFDAMRPVEVDHVVSQDKVGNPPRPLPPTGEGFIQINSRQIALVTWKRAEDGDGSILRLQEIAGKPAEVDVRFPHWHIASAHLCDGVEDNLKSLPVVNNGIRLSFTPFEVLTVRVNATQ
ncbi:MAG: glycosyl hydrolase-related protein, partial [Candidatus Acidiferrales bacterium]